MRHTYDELTPETEAAMRPCVGGIAYELNVTDKYLYALLGGEKTDPFARFLPLFRATSRKNPAGAQGYIVRLNKVYAEENPADSLTAGLNEADLEFDNVKALLRARAEGRCSQSELEAAKYRFIEKFARLGLPERMGEMQPS